MSQVARGRPITNAELVDSLCSASATLSEGRRVHLNDYGCLIPHVFMSYVLKHVGECLGASTAAARATNRREVDAILAALEQGMVDGGRETRNVIALSFTRDSELEEFFDELRPMMGARMRAELHGG